MGKGEKCGQGKGKFENEENEKWGTKMEKSRLKKEKSGKWK
jgi:hypothetical protein